PRSTPPSSSPAAPRRGWKRERRWRAAAATWFPTAAGSPPARSPAPSPSRANRAASPASTRPAATGSRPVASPPARAPTERASARGRRSQVAHGEALVPLQPSRDQGAVAGLGVALDAEQGGVAAADPAHDRPELDPVEDLLGVALGVGGRED